MAGGRVLFLLAASGDEDVASFERVRHPEVIVLFTGDGLTSNNPLSMARSDIVVLPSVRSRDGNGSVHLGSGL
jgi:hypothetical protein